MRVYKDRTHSRSHKAKICKDKGIYCTCCTSHTSRKERCTKKGHTSAKKLLSDTQAQTGGSIAHVVRHTNAKQELQSKGVQEIGHTSTKKLLSDTQA